MKFLFPLLRVKNTRQCPALTPVFAPVWNHLIKGKIIHHLY